MRAEPQHRRPLARLGEVEEVCRTQRTPLLLMPENP
jgi:hypothetical protein